MRRVLHRIHQKTGSGSSRQGTPSDTESQSAGSVTGVGPFWVGVASDCNTRYRKGMEDMHLWELDYLKVPGNGFFAVFDGHAGPQTAQYCYTNLIKVLSENLVTSGEEVPGESADVPKALHETFTTIDRQLQDQPVKNSGSTAAVALVRNEAQGRRLYVANVGDTRVVLSRGGRAFRLSYDHRGNDAHEGKRIYNAGGLIMNGRVNGVLAVTRSLGDLYMKDYVVGDPYTTETALQEQDQRLIIACDGLWDVCTDQKAVDLIKNIADPEKASSRLLKYALENFSTDNLTVMVVNLTDMSPHSLSATSSETSTVSSPSGRKPGSAPAPDPASDKAIETTLESEAAKAPGVTAD